MKNDAVLLDPPPFSDLFPSKAKDVFGGLPRNEKSYGGTTGVLRGASFDPSEVSRIEKIIQEHIIERVNRYSTKAADLISSISLENYHNISHLVEETLSKNNAHSTLFSKLGRILSKKAVDEIKSMSFFDYIKNSCGEYYLSDEECVGYEQICFRVVRPNCRDDVGSLHRDAWFWEYHGFRVPEGYGRGKMWTQICGSPNESGLLLVPNSHLAPGGFKTETIDGKLMFISEIDPSLPLRRFSGAHGDTVLFNYQNLHTGSINRGSTSRVSIEVTVMFKED